MLGGHPGLMEVASRLVDMSGVTVVTANNEDEPPEGVEFIRVRIDDSDQGGDVVRLLQNNGFRIGSILCGSNSNVPFIRAER